MALTRAFRQTHSMARRNRKHTYPRHGRIARQRSPVRVWESLHSIAFVSFCFLPPTARQCTTDGVLVSIALPTGECLRLSARRFTSFSGGDIEVLVKACLKIAPSSQGARIRYWCDIADMSSILVVCSMDASSSVLAIAKQLFLPTRFLQSVSIQSDTS